MQESLRKMWGYTATSFENGGGEWFNKEDRWPLEGGKDKKIDSALESLEGT